MGGFEASGHDPATDRAAALIRNLDGHKSEEPRIADPMERLTARIIDLCAWAAFGLAWSVIAFYTDRAFFEDGPDPFAPIGPNGEVSTLRRLDPSVSWGSFIGLVLTIYAYETIPTAFRGRHFAKRRLKLRVVGPDGEPPGFWRATVRWVVWWVPCAGGLVLWGGTIGSSIGFLAIGIQFAALAIPGTIFFDDAHRGIHDRIAGTRVLAER